MNYGPEYRVDALLRDGRSIRIRALHSDDGERLRELFGRLAARSIYFRFFRDKVRLTDADLSRLTDLDHRERAALAATLVKGGCEKIVGIGRYAGLSGSTGERHRAELLLTVVDAHQGKGIGTLLLDHVIPVARANGFAELTADVLDENGKMLHVLANSGYRIDRSSAVGVTHFVVHTEETAEAADARLLREISASAHSIHALMNPRSLAIIGASRQHGTIGGALVELARSCGYTGHIYPINPRADDVAGLKCYPSVAATGAPVDVALIAVPSPFVEGAVRDCAAADVKGVVIISAGFGEVSAEGRAAEIRLRDLARTSGMRMVGPNCMGLLNTDPSISLNATFVPAWPAAGNIGILSQSGALGFVILDRIQSLSVGISSFISVGNKADVSDNDLLAYWSEDPATKVIVLYLESFVNPRLFARIAPQVARSKPIVAMKTGRSAAGKRAASSHSAALASPDVYVDALLEKAGAIRTNTLEELMDVSVLLSSQPLPKGRRVGIITNGGGPGILLADACEANGLEVPELSESTLGGLRAFLPTQASLANPIDLIASAGPDQYAEAIRLTGNDPNIDALMVIYIPPHLHRVDDMAVALARAAGEVPGEKPVLIVFMSSHPMPRFVNSGARGRIPSYSFPENAARALAAAGGYARWRHRPQAESLRLDRSARAAVREVVERALECANGPAWLEHQDLARIMRAAGIECAEARVAAVDEAPLVAEQMGYPLVIKVESEGIRHKTDLGGVLLGLHSRGDVAAGLKALGERLLRLGLPLKQVLIQREVSGGMEALVGVTVDPAFGPLLVCGLGGVMVEIWKDVSFGLVPLTRPEVEEMLDGLRSAALLEGYRGSRPMDRDALIGVIERVSALSEAIPELIELDLNPVKVMELGKGAIVVDARLRIERT